MNRHLVIIFSFLLFSFSFGQKVDQQKLSQEISDLNDKYEYETSILKLEEIINNNRSTEYDKYFAYIQKALTYKRLYNYPEVLINLELAEKHGMKSDRKEEVELRIMVERMFVKFDSTQFDEARELNAQINEKNLDLLDAETKSFYLVSNAHFQMQDGNYSKAKEILNDALNVLENENPKHLPVVYAKLIRLYQYTEDKENALAAFEKGMFYADKYNTDIYRISVLYALSHFYMAIGDYENAYLNEIKRLEISSRYNAPVQSGKLNILEKDILDTKKNLELQYERRARYFLIILTVILSLLIIVLIKLAQSNKQKRKLIERENQRMRIDLQELSKELNEKGEAKLKLKDYKLTNRQIEVINLVRQGKTNKEIGAELFISENTVKYHLKIIYNELGIENRTYLKSTQAFNEIEY